MIDSILDTYRMSVVTITIPIFGYKTHEEYLRNLAGAGEFVDVPLPPTLRRGSVRPTTKTYLVKFNEHQFAQFRQFKDTLEKIFNRSFLTAVGSTEPMFTNGWDLFEHLLKNHDWYYMMSDDHSVWSNGEFAFKRIQSIKDALEDEDADKANELYDKYCPFDKENLTSNK